MTRVHAMVGESHYLDHIAPIWANLEDHERGSLYAPAPTIAGRAQRMGLPGVVPRRPPRRVGEGGLFLVAGAPDLRAIGARPAIFVEHGSGQTYRGVQVPNFAGGPGRDRVRLFLCPSDRIADANRERYPSTPSAVVGCPKLDGYARLRAEAPAHSKPVVVVTFHWNCGLVPETKWAWPEYAPAVAALAGRPDITVVGHAHPRVAFVLGRWWESIGVPFEPDLGAALARADVLIADNTSAIWEAAALGVKVVLLNSKHYRRNVNHGLRFWSHADAGLNVNHPSFLASALEQTIAGDPQRHARARAACDVYAHLDGSATQRALTATRDLIA